MSALDTIRPWTPADDAAVLRRRARERLRWHALSAFIASVRSRDAEHEIAAERQVGP